MTRFIPSDFAADFTKLTDAENRNFAFRRAFRERLLAAPIRSTSILNGAFTEILMYGTPMLDFERRSVGYWESADQPLDFTTMNDTAAFTAAAALDASAPPVLRVAGDSLSARTLAEVASEVKGHAFELARMGSLEDLAGYIARERAAHPETENEVFPRWQSSQYMHNMFSGRAKLEPLDNARYPGIRYTTVRDFIAAAGARLRALPTRRRTPCRRTFRASAFVAPFSSGSSRRRRWRRSSWRSSSISSRSPPR